MTEKPVTGVRGWFLLNPHTGEYFFRVYTSADKQQYTDYRLTAADIEVELLGSYLSLYEDQPASENYLGYNSRVRRHTKQGPTDD